MPSENGTRLVKVSTAVDTFKHAEILRVVAKGYRVKAAAQAADPISRAQAEGIAEGLELAAEALEAVSHA